MSPEDFGLLILKGFALFFIILYGVKLGVKEALAELKENETKLREP